MESLTLQNLYSPLVSIKSTQNRYQLLQTCPPTTRSLNPPYAKRTPTPPPTHPPIPLHPPFNPSSVCPVMIVERLNVLYMVRRERLVRAAPVAKTQTSFLEPLAIEIESTHHTARTVGDSGESCTRRSNGLPRQVAAGAVLP
jgi:hypothetical protein